MRYHRVGDPTLVAKPGFHDERPGGVCVAAVPIGHTLDIVPELLEYFTENPLAGRPGRGCAAQAAQPTVIEDWRWKTQDCSEMRRLAVAIITSLSSILRLLSIRGPKHLRCFAGQFSEACDDGDTIEKSEGNRPRPTSRHSITPSLPSPLQLLLCHSMT